MNKLFKYYIIFTNYKKYINKLSEENLYNYFIFKFRNRLNCLKIK